MLVYGVDRTFLRVIAIWPLRGSSGCCRRDGVPLKGGRPPHRGFNQGELVVREFEVLHFLALGDIRREKGELQRDRWIGLYYIHRIDAIRMLGIKTEKAQPEEVFSSLFSLWPTQRQVSAHCFSLKVLLTKEAHHPDFLTSDVVSWVHCFVHSLN